jgi:hypothetical protein
VVRTARRFIVVSAVAALWLGLAGCSAQPGLGSDAPDASTDGSSTSEGAEDDNGRAFDSTDDAVITAVMAALKPDRAEWHGSSLKAYFTEGSVNDPTASIGCLALQTIIAEDETGFMVYPDGEFDCSTKY